VRSRRPPRPSSSAALRSSPTRSPQSGPRRLEFTVAAFQPGVNPNDPFNGAAFQPGVNPNDPFNGAGQIAPLTLPIATDTRGTKGTCQ
jgi:hypothetical protein